VSGKEEEEKELNYWIGSGQYAATSIQLDVNSSLCDSNCLLFHDFVHSDSILFAHLIKLIYATNTSAKSAPISLYEGMNHIVLYATCQREP